MSHTHSTEFTPEIPHVNLYTIERRRAYRTQQQNRTYKLGRSSCNSACDARFVLVAFSIPQCFQPETIYMLRENKISPNDSHCAATMLRMELKSTYREEPSLGCSHYTNGFPPNQILLQEVLRDELNMKI